MARHCVKLSDIKGFTTETELVGSHGRGQDKSLIAKVTFDSKNIEFKIIDHNNVISIEQDLEKAIEVYNEL
mgnify:CR=1 FL=1